MREYQMREIAGLWPEGQGPERGISPHGGCLGPDSRGSGGRGFGRWGDSCVMHSSFNFDSWLRTRQPWMRIAEAELGVREIAGSTHEPRIIEYHATTGRFTTDEVPWCSSFLNWVIEAAGLKGTKSAAALSWRNWGKTLASPSYGSIAVMDYGRGRGHVAFVAGRTATDSLVLLGGNQADSVCLRSYRRSSIAAYVYPKDFVPEYQLPQLTATAGGGFASTR